MKKDCSIVRDLLPLYVEDMVSPDTAEFVKEHLDSCPECKNEHGQLKEPAKIPVKTDAKPLLRIKRKLWTKRLMTVAFTLLLVMALLLSGFAFISAPEYLPYSEDLITITENADGSITLTFDEQVMHFRSSACVEPYTEGDNGEHYQYVYHVEAWTSLWDRWFSNRSVQSFTISEEYPEGDGPIVIYYSSNNGKDDVCIYGEEPTDYAGVVTLPRLVLAYYLFLAFFIFGNLLGLWFILRFALPRKTTLRRWTERLSLYPLSYILAHFAVKGLQTDSYGITRDFLLIVLISILIYCSALLIHSVIYLRKEIRETNR